MFAAPIAPPHETICGGEEEDGPHLPVRKRQKQGLEGEEEQGEGEDHEPVLMCLGQPPNPSLPLPTFTITNYKKVPYFSARWSPQAGHPEDPSIAMIARAVQALFGIHVHPFPVDFVSAFKSVMEPPGGSTLTAHSLPLWVLSFHIMDHVVHKKEMPRAVQVKLRKEHLHAPFLGIVKKFVSHPDQFGFFLSHFLHHLLAEWIAASTTELAVGSAVAVLSLMRRLLTCSLVKWTLFYDRSALKDVASFNESSLFCHCLNHLGIGNHLGSANANSSDSDRFAPVLECSALYGFGGDHHTIFHHCLLLHPAIMGPLSGPLFESPSIQSFIREDPSSIFWLTIGKQIFATLYFDLYQLPRRHAKRYSQLCIIRTPNECFWWLLLPVSETPTPEPVDFPWANQDLLFPCIFGFGPDTLEA